MKNALLKKPDGTVLLPKLGIAETFGERLKGLLGRANVPDDEGLLLSDCVSVHTFFMRCTVDILFLSAEQRVTEIVGRAEPGRVIRCRAPEGRHTLEIGEGRAHELAIGVGDEMLIENTHA